MKEADFKMKSSNLKPPFVWVGGKSKIAKEIVEKMPKHTTYTEIFGGALLCFMLKRDYVQNTQK